MKSISSIQQHNLHLSYREALAKSTQPEQRDAFARFVTGLSEEELAYIDELVSRDLCETLTQCKG